MIDYDDLYAETNVLGYFQLDLIIARPAFDKARTNGDLYTMLCEVDTCFDSCNGELDRVDFTDFDSIFDISEDKEYTVDFRGLSNDCVFSICEMEARNVGRYIPATREEPAEYPELVPDDHNQIRILNKVNKILDNFALKYDCERHKMDLQETNPEMNFDFLVA